MKIELCQEAKEALGRGIEEGHTIADLEDYLDQGIIDCLDRHNIIMVEDLVNLTLADLADVPSIGVKAVNQILDVLLQYHKIHLVDV